LTLWGGIFGDFSFGGANDLLRLGRPFQSVVERMAGNMAAQLVGACLAEFPGCAGDFCARAGFPILYNRMRDGMSCAGNCESGAGGACPYPQDGETRARRTPGREKGTPATPPIKATPTCAVSLILARLAIACCVAPITSLLMPEASRKTS
jgi:hypothetical protein